MSRAYVECRLLQYLSGPLTSFSGMNGSLGNQKLSPSAGSSRTIASNNFFARAVSSSLSSGGKTLLSATNGRGTGGASASGDAASGTSPSAAASTSASASRAAEASSGAD